MLPDKFPKDSAGPSTHHVLILHEVRHYPAWKKIFDDAAGQRKAAGEQAYQVLCHESDANKVVHFSAWSSHADAKRFFQSAELEEIRKRAGVKAPEFIYLNQLEAGVL